MAKNANGSRRRHERHTLTLQVSHHGADHALSSWTENLSAGGLFVNTDEPLVPGDNIAIDVSFPGLLDPVALDATVAWVRPETPDAARGVGVSVVGDKGRPQIEHIAAIAAGDLAEAPVDALRVLVVEDNDVSARMYSSVLRAYGATTSGGIDVQVADNGKAALDLLTKEPVDLVITDLFMPVMDGFEMVAALRADEHLKPTPILVISCGGREERLRAKEVGVDAYLEKPVRFGDLVETITCLHQLR